MDKQAPEIMQHASFVRLSSSALVELISRNSFNAPEIDIFLAVKSWVLSNAEEDAKRVLGSI